MARGDKGKAAYTLVDISDVDPDVRKLLYEDAMAGGGTYGLQVVEMVHNGPAQAPIFGYYHAPHPNEAAWEETKAEFGIGAKTIDDTSVHPEENDDPRREAALRDAAVEAANAEAERVRTAEDEEVRKIAGDTKPVNKIKRG